MENPPRKYLLATPHFHRSPATGFRKFENSTFYDYINKQQAIIRNERRKNFIHRNKSVEESHFSAQYPQKN